MPVWAQTDEVSTEMGFKIQIHDQGEPPLITELGLGISPGFQTLVTAKEQKIKFLSEPYGKCIETGIPIPQFEKEFPSYSVSGCRIACETRFVSAYCKCKMAHMPISFNASYCMPEDYQMCADPALDWLVKEDNTKCVCGTPCELTKYSLSTSQFRLPSKYGVEFYADKYNRSMDYVKENFAKLNVFFEALRFGFS